MPGALDPQRRQRLLAALIDGEPVREVDDLVLGAVDDENGRRDARHFVDAAQTETGRNS